MLIFRVVTLGVYSNFNKLALFLENNLNSEKINVKILTVSN